MTAPARIKPSEMEAATKAVAAAGLTCARVVMDFANQRIEVIIGEPEPASPLPDDPIEEWTDDDV